MDLFAEADGMSRDLVCDEEWDIFTMALRLLAKIFFIRASMHYCRVKLTLSLRSTQREPFLTPDSCYHRRLDNMFHTNMAMRFELRSLKLLDSFL